jgi:hypothetical protein
MVKPKSTVVHQALLRLQYPVQDAEVLGMALKERGTAYPFELLTRPRHRHKISMMHGDIGRYIAQVEEPAQATAPFKYRFLPTAIVRVLRGLTGEFTPTWFLRLNILYTLIAGLWFIRYLRDCFSLGSPLALLGGALFVTIVQVTATLPFALLEPASLLAVLPLFVFAHARRPIAFAISAAIGVMVKEVLVVGALLWLATQVDFKERSIRRWLEWLVVAAVPVAAFAMLRTAMGGGALEVGFGHNVLEGEGPSYLRDRLQSASATMKALSALFLGFGGLWLGLVGALRDPFLRRALWVVPCTLLAALGFSGFIGRVVGVIYPIVIPGFLLLLQHALREHEPAVAQRAET